MSLKNTLQRLDQIAPRFKVYPQSVTVFNSPDEFYSQLKDRILSAKNRIFLATLYIGKSQHELIQVLDQSLTKNQQLDVHILTDGLRGTREAPNPCTASLLAPLVEKYPARVHVSQYQTPTLQGLAKKLIPARFNEGFGLQHMKLYGIDDEIILSGANLSTDYFTDRQDRYIGIADKAVTGYFFNLFKQVAYLSYQVKPCKGPSGLASDNFKLVWDSKGCPAPYKDSKEYLRVAKQKLLPLMKPFEDEKRLESLDGTYVYPIAQLTPLVGPGESNEIKAMTALTSLLKSGDFDWTLTAGYFNIAEQLQKNLLESKPNKATVITAGETANGFYNSKGVSSQIPGLYSMLAQRFVKEAEKKQPAIKMLEWTRGVVNQPNGWSYHAKGLWISPSSDSSSGSATEQNPILTVVGSSNFTKRAYTHDLEAGAVLVTGDKQLQAELGAEVANLKAHTQEKSSRDYPRAKLIHRLFVSVMGDKL